mmetsp:Transcript_60187/g.131840  ORF Transcript_60187/g.131840 Transcript_60187/m.131840 type:complete len:252 (-) Transcript_60187:55-810(-)
MDCFPKLLDPTESFLCCLSLTVGVKLLMWPHLVLVLYTVATAIENLIGEDNGPGASQLFETLWSLIGVPVLFAGLWGVCHRAEPHVRLYWYYLVASFIIDLFYIVNLFILQDACVHLKLEEAAHGGQAFACGVARSISTTAAVVSIIVALYLIYIVWSWCEDVDSSQGSDAIASLLDLADGIALKKPSFMFERNMMPDVVGPSMDATESIISGASIFYGSVSNVVIGEAKAVTEFVGTQIDDIETYAIGQN